MTTAALPTTGLSRRHGIAAIATLVALTVVALVAGWVSDTGIVETIGGVWLPTMVTYPVAAGLLVLVRPDLRYGWTFMAFTVMMVASMACYGVAAVLAPGPAAWVNAVGDGVNTSTVTMAIGMLPMLFPTGHLPSARWRPARWVVVAAATTGGLAALLTGGWGGDPDQTLFLSPLYARFGDLGARLTNVFYPLFMASMVLAAASVIQRFRASTGIERKQLQWLVVAAAYSLLIVASSLTVGSVNKNAGGLDALLTSVGFSLIPAAICIAVLRYRLYDVDVVIDRSLMVAGLALFILVVYVGVVVGVGTLVTGTAEPTIGLQIAATALVAVGFQPWRRRMRRWADRVVYGHRASPYEVLGSFAAIAARTPDDDTRHEIASLLASGTGASPAVVWLRVGDRLRAVASAPSAPLPPTHTLEGEVLPGDIPGDLVVPVEHDGMLLGALAVSKPRGEAITDQDVDVTTRLASGVALTLRTERLTAELAERLDDLHDSRVRLVAAQDEARRRMERDLHDGAQQQLVALRVKLGLAGTLAERADAPRTAEVLEQVRDDADQAVESLRQLARGIYPPLLEAEGLATALTAQARRAALPVQVRGQVGRHPRPVEVAVYFCVLEALQNAAKYSDAVGVFVTLRDDGDELAFTVEDDGRGFDPEHAPEGSGIVGMRDRLDTIDGVLDVDSTPGEGTTIRGRVPVRQPVGSEA